MEYENIIPQLKPFVCILYERDCYKFFCVWMSAWSRKEAYKSAHENRRKTNKENLFCF